MAERKITQIMPANGWAAVFDEDGDELLSPLVGWALVQDGEGQASVVGLVAWQQVELCDRQPNFTRYAYVADLYPEDEEFDEFDDDDDDGMDPELDDGPPYDPKTGLLN
jgi:hypothetical protein